MHVNIEIKINSGSVNIEIKIISAYMYVNAKVGDLRRTVNNV